MDLAHAVDLVRRHGATAQLCVIRHGEIVLDEAFGCDHSALFWIFSASKPFSGMLVQSLAEQGRVSLDAPVAEYWPEYARHGKGAITVRHVLQHRSGVPTGGSGLGDILAMTDWQRSVRRVAHARPRWPAGTVPAYQFLSYGFVLGEIVSRVTGTPIAEYLRSVFLEPLGLHDTHLGLPDELWGRHVPVRGLAPVEAVLNRKSTRRAIIPAAGISTTARDLASWYSTLLRGGAPVLSEVTVERARTLSTDGEMDRYARKPIRWAEGFQLGGPRFIPGAVGPMGRLSSPLAFGHNGSNVCIGWADPDRDVAIAYLTNRVTGRNADLLHQADVADAIITACVN